MYSWDYKCTMVSRSLPVCHVNSVVPPRLYASPHPPMVYVLEQVQPGRRLQLFDLHGRVGQGAARLITTAQRNESRLWWSIFFREAWASDKKTPVCRSKGAFCCWCTEHSPRCYLAANWGSGQTRTLQRFPVKWKPLQSRRMRFSSVYPTMRVCHIKKLIRLADRLLPQTGHAGTCCANHSQTFRCNCPHIDFAAFVDFVIITRVVLAT